MVSIEQCRSAIGAFASVSQKVREQIDNIKGIDIDELYEEFDQMLHVLLHFWKEYLLHYLGTCRTINEVILKWKLLSLSNDIETNPGPEMERVVAGSSIRAMKDLEILQVGNVQFHCMDWPLVQ